MRAWWTFALVFCAGLHPASAQDSRPAREPSFPPTCAVIRAKLAANVAGPVMPSGVSEDEESASETGEITAAMTTCAALGTPGAVELAPGSGSNIAFLIDPITLPPKISLIIDGGVTVYATRAAAKYQNPNAPTLPYPPNQQLKCGMLTDGFQNEGCLPLISLGSDSGVYGHGVIDGQGNQYMTDGGRNLSTTWWDLENAKQCLDKDGKPTTSCLQQAPILIVGQAADQGLAHRMTFYKVTLRNPPFHNVWFGGTDVTVWGVKVQAPWTIGNTAAFVVHGENILIRDATIANGDQDIVIEAHDQKTRNVTIDRVTAYGRGGINVADLYTNGVENILVRDFNMTGDLPSVVGTTVNGVPEAMLQRLFGLQSYGQALPNAASLFGLQITMLFGDSQWKREVRNVTFDRVCLQDIRNAINVGPAPGKGGDGGPALEGVVFRNVHVLAPTSQFPALDHGIPTGGPGSYNVTFVADPKSNFYNHITFDNLVFDDQRSGLVSLGTVQAVGNRITARANVFPRILNELDTTSPPSGWTLQQNSYVQRAPVTTPSRAHGCTPDLWPFVIGELYVSMGEEATGSATNLASADVPAGTAITLNAVVQPAMTQTTDFRPLGYGSYPGLVAVGSPPLRNKVVFLDNGRPVGSASLAANGTLATLRIARLARGTHKFTAFYPPDPFYKGYRFGSVTVQAR